MEPSKKSNEEATAATVTGGMARISFLANEDDGDINGRINNN